MHLAVPSHSLLVYFDAKRVRSTSSIWFFCVGSTTFQSYRNLKVTRKALGDSVLETFHLPPLFLNREMGDFKRSGQWPSPSLAIQPVANSPTVSALDDLQEFTDQVMCRMSVGQRIE